MRNILFLILIVTFALFAQPPARPQFEVASIKRSEEQGTMYVRSLPGGRLLVNAPVRLMLMNAYSVEFSQLVGAPDWLSSETWTIDARAPGNPTRDELMLTLQSLLAERFHLKVHHSSREMSVYALTVGKNGPRLPAPKEGACATPGTGQSEPAPPCGGVRISMSPHVILMEGGSAPLSELARVLAIPLRRIVTDRDARIGAVFVPMSVSLFPESAQDLQ